MVPRLRDRPSVLARSAMRWWDRIAIRVQGGITVALPLLAVVVSAGLAVSGNSQRVTIETDIQRRFETSAALGGLSSLMVNAETGMRGFLLTGQAEFLQPFDQATRELPAAIGRLDELTSDEPTPELQNSVATRLRSLAAVTDRQMTDLTFQRDAVLSGRSGTDPEIRGHLAYGKELMDRIRAEVGDLQAQERARLDARIADIDAIRRRDYLSVVLALIAAVAMRFLAWYLFRNGIVRRVERLTGHLRARRSGTPSPLAPPTKRDQMGELEREVVSLDHHGEAAPGSTSAR